MRRGLRFFATATCPTIELGEHEVVFRNHGLVPSNALDVGVNALSFLTEPLLEIVERAGTVFEMPEPSLRLLSPSRML
jgi:hypothetical protein